jgi:hypothetical protein
MADKKTKVYWAPVFFDTDKNWNMFYYDLESLYDFHRKDISKKSGSNNFFYCPAFKNLAKNTFLIKNPIHSHFVFEDGVAKVKSKNFVKIDMQHEPTIEDNQLLCYGMSYVFFSEDPVTLKLTSPFFNKSDYVKFGNLVPGQLKIDSWFRVLNLEFNLWNNVNEFELKEDEIIGYVNFENNESDIELIRFEMNDTLYSYASACGTSTTWETFVPLVKRYNRFKKTRTNKLVIAEIKKNIVNV